MAFRKKHRDKLVEDEINRKDLGFGTKITGSNTRLVNRDGSFNIRRVGASFWGYANVYNRLITMRWTKFMLLVLALYVVANFVFGLLYYYIGVESLHGADTSTEMTSFSECFFFSAQTLTTVGYGKIAPHGFWASSVAAIESLLGLMVFALATGLLYGRFSRPEAKVIFSKNAIISPYLDTIGLMFRIVNERSNQLIEVSVEVALSLLQTQPDGKETRRRYYNLTLERNKVNFFPTDWTIVHPITEDSPLFGLSSEQFIERDAEIMVMFRGIEDTFSQVVYTRTSYHARDLVWGAKFSKMFDNDSPGVTALYLEKLSDYQEVALATNLPEREENA